MYYIKYNGVDLTEIINVKEVEIPSLPSMSHSSTDMFERNGSVYNGMNYGTRDINIKFIIKAANAKEYEQFVNDTKRAFYTKDEAQLFCGDEENYIWCVPVDDLIITELGTYCAEGEVSLIAYDPYWYNSTQNIVNNKGSKQFTVTNNGDIETYPIINLGFTKDTTFAQITNQESGETILLGGIPSVEGTTIKANTKILDDNMESTNGWSTSTAPIDSGRAVGGTIAVSSAGATLMCGDFGSASSGAKWHGACYRKSLGQSLTDFKVKVSMFHNSSGINGDPLHPFKDDEQEITSGSKHSFYMVGSSFVTVLRNTPDFSGEPICTIPPGTELTGTVKSNWLETTYNGQDGYTYAPFLLSMTNDGTVTTTQANYVTIKNTDIRASASDTATIKKTIPAGQCIRVITDIKYPESGPIGVKESFYKLAKEYEGVTGYVAIENLIKASEYTVKYENEPITADDKTGVLELYGFSANNTQLFKLSMIDDNEYYEFTYPLIKKNGEDFLIDKTIAPAPKTESVLENNTENIKKVLSGKYGGWNEFYGDLYIERVGNKWSAYVQKIEGGNVVKTISSKTIIDTKNENEKLNYLVLYIGTTGNADKACGMSLGSIKVYTGAEIDNTITYNFQKFEAGDIVTINNNIPAVYLNSVETNDIIDIASSFFPLVPGENTLKVSSDSNVMVDILWNNKKI